MRVQEHPIVTFEPGRTVAFTMDGISMQGREGEPIAAALISNGVHAFRHTHRDHEPRGLFCGIGQCTDCVVVVDGTPNVRACVTPLREGMRVETQEGFGQLGVRL